MTTAWNSRNVPKGFENPELTAYVRFFLFDRDGIGPTDLGKQFGFNKQWVINVRDGLRGVGADAEKKIAAVVSNGSRDKLTRMVQAWAEKNPHFVRRVMVEGANTNADRAVALLHEANQGEIESLRSARDRVTDLQPEAPTLTWVFAISKQLDLPPAETAPVVHPTPPAQTESDRPAKRRGSTS